MKRSILSRAGSLLPGHYAAPAIVPPWGIAEFRAVLGCCARGRVLRGPHVAQLAAEVRSALGVRYAIPISRGRTAVELALRGMGIGPGCDVVTPSYTCRSVPGSISRTGARPVFADVGPDLHVTRQTIADAITPATRCVIVPHLFGNTAPIDETEAMLEGTGVALLDDAAQALGARRGGRLAGTFGRCGVLSFVPGKPVQTPSGGMVVTNDREVYERASSIMQEDEPAAVVVARLLSTWWWLRLARHTTPLRVCADRLRPPTAQPSTRLYAMPNVCAAMALCQVPNLDAIAERRRARACEVAPYVDRVGRIVTDLGPNGVALRLVLLLHPGGPSVGEVAGALSDCGLEALPAYYPCHLRVREDRPVLPTTEALWQRCITLPLDLPARRPERIPRALARIGLS